MSDETILWSRFFMAVPEAVYDKALLDYLRGKGFIDDEAVENALAAHRALKRSGHIVKSLRGKGLLERLYVIAPELINRQMVDVLERFKLMDATDANLLRLGIRLGGIGKGGPASALVILQRAKKVFGIGFANDTLNLAVSMGHLTSKQANQVKAGLLSSQSALETLQAIRTAKSLHDILFLTAHGIINDRNVRALRLAGLLDNRTANAIAEAIDYGTSLWTVFEGSRRADGYAARLAYTVSGAFSHEGMDVVKAVSKMSKSELEKMGIGWMHGRLTPERILLLEVATQLSQRFNRQMMEQMTNRRYRVVPGESPIRSFARSSKKTDDDILQLLSKAAEDARKRSKILAGTARGSQYALQAAQLHQTMRELWEGNGFLTIFGEHDVADAAETAATNLEKRYYSKMPQDVQQMLEFSARSGLDSYVSRQENTKQLSRLVYKNMDLWTGKVDQAVNIGLLTGKSADEIARTVQNMINPSVMGGVKYAAMRIGRTELANAFHQTTIRYSREQPWVRGYKWNLSGSHGRTDICNEYAGDDHANMGPGVFKKNNVPDKPHPQCLCYLTIVGVDDKTFISNFNRGFYNQYLNSRVSEPGVLDSFWQNTAKSGARVLGGAAGTVALSYGATLAERFIRHGGPIAGFNFKVLAGLTRTKAAEAIATLQSVYRKGPGAVAASNPKQVAAVVAQIPKEEHLLAQRQANFKGLVGEYAAFDAKHGDLASIEDHYLKVFEGESGTKSTFHINSSGDKREDAAKFIYGMTSYRSLNARLRLAKGDLSVYDDMFPDGSDYFDGMGHLMDDLKDGNVDAGADLLTHTAQALEADVAATPSKWKNIFGVRREDLKDYYSEITDLGTQWFNGDNDFWTGAMSKWRNHSDMVKSLDLSMEPTQRDNFLWRIADHKWMGLENPPTAADVGHIFKDDAYTSTEGRPEYFHNKGVNSLEQEHRAVRYMIHAPAGTMATRLNTFENEIGLSRGTRFQVLDVSDVTDGSGFDQQVLLSLIDQDNVWEEAKEAFAKSEDNDMWDTIMGEF